jgi:hypothetical protein
MSINTPADEIKGMEKDLFTPPSPAERNDELARGIREAAAKAADLQEELNRTRKLERLLQELQRFHDAGWPLHLKATCERDKDFLRSLREEGHPVVAVVEGLYQQAQERARHVVQELPAVLEKSATVHRLPLDFTRSSHPNYYFGEDGLIEVEINDKKLTARLKTREGRLADLQADAAAIVERVRQEVDRLFGRPFNGAEFLRNLRIAYLAAAKAGGGSSGAPVPIRAVLNSMTGGRTGSKGYKPDEFLVDLSRLLSQGPAQTDGRHFELQQSKDTQEGMLLLGAAGRGMVNLLIFK